MYVGHITVNSGQWFRYKAAMLTDQEQSVDRIVSPLARIAASKLSWHFLVVIHTGSSLTAALECETA
jgi:hypothetical protein